MRAAHLCRMQTYMERTPLSASVAHVGKMIRVAGFVQTIRNQGSITFLLLRDATGMLQIVVLKAHAEAHAAARQLTVESVVAITGRMKKEAQAPTGYEMEAEAIEVLSRAEPELPIPVNPDKGGGESEQNLRFDWRWLDLRNPEKLNIFKAWTALEKGFREQWLEEGYLQVYSPSFMSSPSESGAEVFAVQYFDRKAYLAQSPQFYKQMAMAAGMERVFIVGPVFRAEPSYTTRHMTEFTGWDFEMSFVGSHHEVMDAEERLIRRGFAEVNRALGTSFAVPSKSFPRLAMSEAKAKFERLGVHSEKEGDLSPEEERALGKAVQEETGSEFVFVTDYPVSVRPFYHMRHEKSPDLTKSFDLLYRGIEVTTGAQREHRYEVLKQQAVEKKMNLASIENYLNFFRYGCPPHGGAGIGPGRMIMAMLELPTVKETALVPRDVKRLTP